MADGFFGIERMRGPLVRLAPRKSLGCLFQPPSAEEISFFFLPPPSPVSGRRTEFLRNAVFFLNDGIVAIAFITLYFNVARIILVSGKTNFSFRQLKGL